MPDNKIKILVAEDDYNLGALLSDFLGAEGFDVKLCGDGQEALTVFSAGKFDLCLVDVMMPRMDGFNLVKGIRGVNKEVPVIFITAKSLKEDKHQGYEIGADDYITKPFDEDELLWKINALVRRSVQRPVQVEGPVKIGKYSFDFSNQLLKLDAQEKRITEKESEVLRYLCLNRNKIIKREEMLKTLWGENDYFMGRSLDVFITKLRKYLKDDPAIKIENVFGVGFIFHA